MVGIRNKDHQIELKGIVPWIDDLEIEDIFKDEDGGERVGIIDLISGLVEILWLETRGVQDNARQALAPVEPWDKG